MAVLVNKRPVRIEWGDCDPAGIVFYPRYFSMFDHSTVLLIEQALGMRKHKLYEHYAFAGYPSLGSQARFSLQHLLTLDGKLAVEGNETRCWVVRDASRPGGLRAQPMPDEVVAKFSATTA